MTGYLAEYLTGRRSSLQTLGRCLT